MCYQNIRQSVIDMLKTNPGCCFEDTVAGRRTLTDNFVKVSLMHRLIRNELCESVGGSWVRLCGRVIHLS